MSQLSTYTEGYTLIALHDITKADIAQLCRLLEAEFNNKYMFKPEPISEGGIMFNNLPASQYKSMRLFGINRTNYGWIKDDVLEQWTDDKTVLCKQGTIVQTFLKSFDGAAPWTVDELKKFAIGFCQIGFKIKGKYPKKI